MASIKIIEGDFPKQTARIQEKSWFVAQSFITLRGRNREKCKLPLRDALASVEIINSHWRRPTIKIVLVDGHMLIAKADKKTIEHLNVNMALGPIAPSRPIVADVPRYEFPELSLLSKETIRKISDFSLYVLSAVFLLIAFILAFSSSIISVICWVLMALTVMPAITKRLRNAGLPASHNATAFVVVGLIVLSIFTFVDPAEKALKATKTEYATNHDVVLADMRSKFEAGEYDAVVRAGSRYKRVAEGEFAKVYYGAVGKADAEREKKRQEEIAAKFVTEKPSLVAELDALISANKFSEAEALYEPYSLITDPDLEKLGKTIKAKREAEQKIQQAAAADAQYLGSVRGYVVFLDQAQADFQSTAANRSDLDTIRKTLVLFSSLADELHKAGQHKDVMTSAQLRYLKATENRLSQFQGRVLPGLRQAFAKNAGQLLWEHDAYVRISGNANKVINISAGMFASNANIKAAHEQVHEILTQLRFNEVRYRWYKEADEFTYFKLDTPSDGKLAAFKFGAFQDVKVGNTQ